MTRLHIDIDEIADYPALAEAFDIDVNEDVRDQLVDFWIDCDHVKVYGEEGRGDHRFVTHNVDDTKFIIHYDIDDPDEAIALIDWFLDGAEGDLIGENGLENNWNDWDKVETGVAYRGGSGYCYGLYAKTLSA